MSNKQATQSIKPQAQNAAKLLRVSTLYLCLAAAPVIATAQLSAPLPVGASTAIQLQTNEPKLIYKASGSKLTVEELEAAQQKKLEEDFYKKAGYTSVAPIVVKPMKASTGAGSITVAKPVNTLFVSGVYGTDGKQKAEVVWNGLPSTVEVGAVLGKVKIESIHAGLVTVAYSGNAVTGKASKRNSKKQVQAPASSLRQTMKAGESLEIPA